MAYAFVQQAEISFAANQSSLAIPSITVTAGNLLVLAITGGTNTQHIFADAGIGNTYIPICRVNTGTRGLYLYYVQNANGGATAVTITGSSSLLGAYMAEYSGLATVQALIGWAAKFQSGTSGTGADKITSGNLQASAQPALVFGFAWDQQGGGANNHAPTAGTSPNVFTARTSVWATFNAGTTCALPEDFRDTSVGPIATTFGSVSSNQFDNWLTCAAAFAESGVVVPPGPYYPYGLQPTVAQ